MSSLPRPASPVHASHDSSHVPAIFLDITPVSDQATALDWPETDETDGWRWTPTDPTLDLDDLSTYALDSADASDAALDIFDGELLPTADETDQAWDAGFGLGYHCLPARPPADFSDLQTVAWHSGYAAGRARGVTDARDELAEIDEWNYLDDRDDFAAASDPGDDYPEAERVAVLGARAYN